MTRMLVSLLPYKPGPSLCPTLFCWIAAMPYVIQGLETLTYMLFQQYFQMMQNLICKFIVTNTQTIATYWMSSN